MGRVLRILWFHTTVSQQYLMDATGWFDIAAGVLVLCWPIRAVLLYMAFWGLLTAFLRPLTEESWFELVER